MARGDKHLFRMNDGRAFEGWVVEVGEDAILVMDSGAAASDGIIEIAIANIDLATLRYVEDGTVSVFATA